MNPNKVKNDTVTAPNRMLRNRLTSSIECAARRSHAMNAASKTAEAAKPAVLRLGVGAGGDRDRGQRRPGRPSGGGQSCREIVCAGRPAGGH